MLVKANQKYSVTKEAAITSLDRTRVMPGGTIKTLTPVQEGREGDKILVTYTGQGRAGEAPNGQKFWVKVDTLVRHSKLID